MKSQAPTSHLAGGTSSVPKSGLRHGHAGKHMAAQRRKPPVLVEREDLTEAAARA
eukprot:CAMPEP_0204316292 /NCGR_PEP_ID=MMETSP0469-20131031/5315_1 /ASSEMBLY_ACC=CAM_ASM_000384 /TAXON_ID=2969 /ORGANISM="Oxyrrhis marina" /LENGTH=54 /DNA_ID=CAMNT_0051297047 /DNA_START=169 /DNA_END=329 /DNA_ORIENTATION=+